MLQDRAASHCCRHAGCSLSKVLGTLGALYEYLAMLNFSVHLTPVCTCTPQLLVMRCRLAATEFARRAPTRTKRKGCSWKVDNDQHPGLKETLCPVMDTSGVRTSFRFDKCCSESNSAHEREPTKKATLSPTLLTPNRNSWLSLRPRATFRRFYGKEAYAEHPGFVKG